MISTLLLLGFSWQELASRLPTAKVPDAIIDSVYSRSKPSFSDRKPTLFRERNGWCPYSERVWIALEAKGIGYDTILIDNMGRGRPDYFNGQTPQIRWADGRVQPESMDIVRQLDKEFPDTQPLYPSDIESEVTSIVNAFKNTFPRNTRPSSRSAFLFYSSGQPVFRSEFEETLTKTDALLGKYQDGPFFLGDRFTAADCAWAPFLERYAAQLPILHKGLNPRDPSRWPRLSAWFDALESERCSFYPSRVQGDRESWRKVLFMSGYGNDGSVPDDSLNVDSAAEYSISKTDERVFAHYASSKSGIIANTPSEEAAARILKNREGIIDDLRRTVTDLGGVSDEEIDEGLRLVATALISGFNTAVGGGIGGAATESEGDRSRQKAAVKTAAKITAYLDHRMCVPRDMGVPPARAIRALNKQLQGLTQS